MPLLFLAQLLSLGTIAGGHPVALESKSVKRAGAEVTAVVRTTFTKPAKAPGGDWYGARTVVAVRCGDGTAAVLENRYYGDAAFKRVVNERIIKQPGYAAPVPGSTQALALAHLCKK